MPYTNARHPQRLARNELNAINALPSPPRKRGSRATSPPHQQVAATQRRSANRLPLDSRFRGNDAQISPPGNPVIHFESDSEGRWPEGRLPGGSVASAADYPEAVIVVLDH